MAEPLAIAIRNADPVSPYRFAVAHKIEEALYPGHKNWTIIQGVSESHRNAMTDEEAATWSLLSEEKTINAEAPLAWDEQTSTMSVSVGTTANDVAAGNHTHSNYATTTALTDGLAGKAATNHTHSTAQVTGLDSALADLDRVAAHVADADPTDAASAAAAVDALRNALIAAGLMGAA